MIAPKLSTFAFVSMFLVTVQAQPAARCMFPCAREMTSCMEACKTGDQKRKICKEGCKIEAEACREDCDSCVQPCTFERAECLAEVKLMDFESDEERAEARRNCFFHYKECKTGLECNTDPCTETCDMELRACRAAADLDHLGTRKDKFLALQNCMTEMRECAKDLQCNLQPTL